jgi:hypothetical protein
MSEKNPPDHARLVNLSDYREKDTEERKKLLLDFIEEIKKKVEEDKIEYITMDVEYQSNIEDETETEICFWNKEESMDVAIGKIERLKMRLLLVSEGLVHT